MAMLELGPSARRLLRSPGFTATAILVLALGIGAAAAMFSFVNAILLRPLPYTEPDRVALVWETRSGAPAHDAHSPAWVNPRESFVSALNLESWQARQRVFESLEPVAFGWYHIPGAGQTLGGRTGPGFFRMLGVEAALGRTYTPQDAGKPVAVLTHALWQRVFGGDPGIIGRKIVLPGDPPLTVIGVLPRDFFFYLRDFELWTPLDMPVRWRASRADRRLLVAGRLKPGVTAGAAEAVMDAIARGLEQSYPETNRGWGVTVVPVHRQFTAFLGPILLVLFGGVGLLLLAACANIANLLLARVASRRKEFAVRTALGASRGDLMGLIAGESLLLALPGALGGLLLARAALPGLVQLLPLKLPVPIPGLENIAVNARVFLFTCVVSPVTAVVAGGIPALRTSTADLRKRNRAGGVLVISEIALATVLLAATSVTVKSVWILFHQDMGFRPGGILTFRTPLEGNRAPEERARIFGNYLSQVRLLPGVLSAAVGYSAPLGGAGGTVQFEIEGRPLARVQDMPHAAMNQVGPDYFRTLGIPLRAGRDFDTSDTLRSTPVLVVSQSVAEKYFPGDDPVGRRVRLRTPGAPWMTVTGIAGDVRAFANGAAEPMLYRPMAQDPPGAIGFVVRTAGDPMSLAGAVRAAIAAVNPEQEVTYLRPIRDDFIDQIYPQRLSALGLGVFGAMTLLLAAVGVFGVTAVSVKQRMHEFGVRLALGARPAHIVGVVLARIGLLTAAGAAIGIGAALAGTRLLEGVLYEVKPADPLMFTAAPMLLFAVAVMAAFAASREAVRANPAAVLRCE